MKFTSDDEYRTFLQKCAATALNSKLIHQEKEFFSKIAVDAVLLLDELLPLNMIGIKKVQGGGLQVIILKIIIKYIFYKIYLEKLKDSEQI